ncbi:thioredoxin domain-containing protein [candidate division TA06 bacterium]|nr:thioredoxin domain-containing protein [candidate division TA06 bacterium]
MKSAHWILLSLLALLACSRDSQSLEGEKGEKNLENANRLIHEKSPYLLQHAYNPVDWYSWGEEALQTAKKENKPIFLSIGYSTCHWCHVMEVESFENEEIAAIMNEHFISIKVDREERPDVDEVYMTAVQAMTGGGGWPLSVFLTPDQKPFFGGTYFPPDDRFGRPGFKKILLTMADAWKTRRDEIENEGARVTTYLQGKWDLPKGGGRVSEAILEKAYTQLSSSFDETYGGFGGGGNKFPRSMTLSFLMRYYRNTGKERALEIVEKTLEGMAHGGMYDQVGGGFHRYSTDPKWLVPHFEKMLYDNALLAKTYLEAYQLTRKADYAQITREILDYVLRDMSHPEGGFYSAEDADSEGEEGVFYVWRPEEIKEVLGEREGDLFCDYYGATPEGNFEGGKSILHVRRELKGLAKEAGIPVEELKEILQRGRDRLLEVRAKRIRPHRDDKILTAWNGLMISSMTYAYQVLEEPKYLEAAQSSAKFIQKELVKKGRLLRRYREGEAKFLGYLVDYAFFVMALIDLYEATFEIDYLKEALRLHSEMVRLFWDEQGGGFFDTGNDGEVLLARSKEVYDGAIPSGNSIAILNLLRLSELTGNRDLKTLAEKSLNSFSSLLNQSPTAYPQLLCGLDFYLDTPKEIVLAGRHNAEDTRVLLQGIHRHFIPNKVLALATPGDGKTQKLIPMLEGRLTLNGKATVYVCENYTCKLPTTEVRVMEELLLGKRKI